MGKSARVLGREFGRTDREMNKLLKEHGYLKGAAGAYGLTEKGQRYAEEQYQNNGYGGSAHRSWETRTWNDETAAALKADMEANPGGSAIEDSSSEEADVVESEPLADCGNDHYDEPQLTWKAYAIGGAVVGGILLAPHVKPFWDDKVKPVAKRVRDTFSKRKPVEAQTLETAEGPE